MFNCKKLFKLQVRQPSLILLITTSQDMGIFASQNSEVKNFIIIIIRIEAAAVLVVISATCKIQLLMPFQPHY